MALQAGWQGGADDGLSAKRVDAEGLRRGDGLGPGNGQKPAREVKPGAGVVLGKVGYGVGIQYVEQSGVGSGWLQVRRSSPVTSAGVRVGQACSHRAMAPATAGVDIDVPLLLFQA